MVKKMAIVAFFLGTFFGKTRKKIYGFRQKLPGQGMFGFKVTENMGKVLAVSGTGENGKQEAKAGWRWLSFGRISSFRLF